MYGGCWLVCVLLLSVGCMLCAECVLVADGCRLLSYGYRPCGCWLLMVGY